MMDLEKPGDVLVMISSALEHHADGSVYDGLCIGCLSWDGDDLIVPVLSEEEAQAENIKFGSAKIVYRVKIERVVL